MVVDLNEHKTILAFLDKALCDAAADPLDLEADAIIRAYFKRNPEAAYRITYMAMQIVPPLRVPAADRQVVRRWSWRYLLMGRWLRS